MALRAFQKRFLRGALALEIRTAALSLPRGNGKSWLAGHLVARILNPDDDLFRSGTESVLLAASYKQARVVYRFARDLLAPMGIHSFVDSANRVSIVHKPTLTKLDLFGSNAKAAMGLVNCPYVVADEPGAWEVNSGTLMYDAISGAQGKPGSPLRAIYIGTLAPALSGWWHDLVADGSHGSVYVMSLQGDRRKWDQWREIRRCNPLMAAFPESRAVLLEERNEARRDSRLKARFLSYRLNLPTADESEVLLTVPDWERVCARAVPGRRGRPIFAYDLGGGRAWSAAVALWPNGRCEAVAVAPGIPSIKEQELRDRVPAGAYQRLVESRRLIVAAGLRVQPVGMLHDAAIRMWGAPQGIVCDRFRLPELMDAVGSVPVSPRMTRWSDASADIRALRKMAADGPLAVEPRSRDLIGVSLSAALVKNDDQGSTRLVKRDQSNNSARDDVAAALVLGAGAMERAGKRRTAPRWIYRGAA